MISIHLLEDHEDVADYVLDITRFLAGKSYKLQRKIGRNYFYQRLNASASRTRKRYPAAEDALGSTTATNHQRIKLGVSCPDDIEVKTSVEQRKIKVVTERNQENTW